MHLLSICTAIILPILAYSANTIVQVGENGLSYSPQTIIAVPGDTVEFQYLPKNHSVVQSSFDAPCKPLTGGFNSGFIPIAEGMGNKSFTITVNDANPIWVYCAQTIGSHCQMGMAMVINEPPAPKTLDAYKNMASNTAASEPPSVVQGGVFRSISSSSTATTTSDSLYASVTSMIGNAASNAPMSTPISYISGAGTVMMIRESLVAMVIAVAIGLMIF